MRGEETGTGSEAQREGEEESNSVLQGLGSHRPEVQAGALNAALNLLFRLETLTATRRAPTLEPTEREAGLIRMPVGEAVRSEDDWTRAKAGAAVLGLMGTLDEIVRKKQRVEKMIQQLRDEMRAARRKRRGQIIKASLLLLGLAVLIYVRGPYSFNFWWIFFPLSGFWARDRSQGQIAVQRLSESWDPRAVGILAVVVQERDPQLKHQALQALANLLPRVRASDGPFIDAEGMQALIELLTEAPETVQLSLLQALEQIGDERAVPAVRTLRDSPEVRADIRQAAADCLPTLHQRAQLARDSATLLRASSSERPGEAAAQLLRPAKASLAQTDNLLRPSISSADVASAQAELPVDAIGQKNATEPPVFFTPSSPSPVSNDTVRLSGTSLT